MRLKTTVVSIAAAGAMLATPAFAAPPTTPHGKVTSSAQICKALHMSQKKTNHGRGQSPFAACVSGVKRARADIAKNPSYNTNPTTLCKDKSHKKSATDKKSPFSACVSGAAKAQNS